MALDKQWSDQRRERKLLRQLQDRMKAVEKPLQDGPEQQGGQVVRIRVWILLVLLILLALPAAYLILT